MITAIFFFITSLSATGCLEVGVSDQFRYGFYGVTLLMVLVMMTYILLKGSIQVVDGNFSARPTSKTDDEQDQSCPICKSDITAETSLCGECGCPVGASNALVDGRVRSFVEPPLKPSGMNHLPERVKFSHGVPGPEFLTSRCPECRLLMYVYDASCPHCEYKLKPTERREMCEKFIHGPGLSSMPMFLFFVAFLFVTFLVIYAAQNL